VTTPIMMQIVKRLCMIMINLKKKSNYKKKHILKIFKKNIPEKVMIMIIKDNKGIQEIKKIDQEAVQIFEKLNLEVDREIVDTILKVLLKIKIGILLI
jgi:hypothetical protein